MTPSARRSEGGPAALLLRLAVVVLCAGGALRARTWTHADGRTVEAELAGTDGESATLRLPDGRTSVVKLAALSSGDVDFARAWLAEHPPGGVTGFEGAWPEFSLLPEAVVVEKVAEDVQGRRCVYRSRHFEFTSPVPLRAPLSTHWARVFEGTHEFARLLPLNHRSTAAGAGRIAVRFFDRTEDYVAAGGMEGTVGVCRWHRGETEILVSLKELGGGQLGKDGVLDSTDADFHALAHETTHALMDETVKQAAWYTEGSAEYVASTRCRGGKFEIARNKSALAADLAAFSLGGRGPGLGREIKMPHLQVFMAMGMGEFMKNARLNYGAACLLTLYFYHLDGRGDAARMKDYLRLLQEEEDEPVAREKLLGGRSWAQLETEFAAALWKAGVKIDFKP